MKIVPIIWPAGIMLNAYISQLAADMVGDLSIYLKKQAEFEEWCRENGRWEP